MSAAPPGFEFRARGSEFRVAPAARNPEPGIRRLPRRDVAAWTALVLALTLLPELLAHLFGPTNLERVHTFLNIWDFNVYLSAMREAAATGAWLVHNHYAIEPHQPRLIHLPYVVVGQIARLLDVEVVPVLVATEVFGRGLVVVAILAFVAVFLPPGRARRIAFLLALFGSGLSLWVGLAGAVLGLGDLPSEYLYYETNTLTLLFSGVHLMFGLGLTVALVALVERVERAGADGRGLAGLAGSSTLLALVHPFNLPVLFSAFSLYALARGWRDRRVPWPLVAALAAVGLAAAPWLLHDLVTITRDPLWSGSYWEQKVVPSPQGLGLVSHLGLPLLLTPFGLLVWRDGGRRRWLAGALVVATLAWMYAPVALQRRFAFGIPLFLAVPAAVGVDWLLAHVPRPAAVWRRVVVYGLLLGAGGTTAAMYAAVLSSAVFGAPYPSYPATAAEARAAAWLGRHMAHDEVVLSAVESGYLLGAWVPGRVVIGHTHETPDYAAKRELMLAFYGRTPDDPERAAIATRLGVDYVFYGPRERLLGPPPVGPAFRLVYEQEGVAIFRVSDG